MTIDAAPALQPPRPGLELMTRLEAALGDPIDLGATPEGHRRIVPITGGRVRGPRLNGVLLAAGADWQIIHPEGWVSVEARYPILTQDGAVISVLSRGVRHGPPEVMRRLLAGERPDPGAYRFRTAMTFEVAQGSEYDWLNHVVAVSSAIREPAAVLIDVYEVT